MKIFVTGGAGFIGSALIRYLLDETEHEVLNYDKLTYAGNLESLMGYINRPQYRFIHGDICDAVALRSAVFEFAPDAVMHLAAESHVDRSIDGPGDFIQTNIVGTFVLLECVRAYWQGLTKDAARSFRFHHISTDEVYGSLGSGSLFCEDTRYDPSSPYSASKAGSDHLVRAWYRTYDLPTVITNCSNNYGPYQFPEKLIPLIILNALDGKPLPVYGNGQQVRDWLYVEDHARALYVVLRNGRVGETYNVGGHNEKTNLTVVETVCEILDRLYPDRSQTLAGFATLIEFVADRPGHDARYAIDAGKIQAELGWVPRETFETGLEKTVRWYIEQSDWAQRVQDGTYQRQRLGVSA